MHVLTIDEQFLYQFIIRNHFKNKVISDGNTAHTSLRQRPTLNLDIPDYNNKHGKKTQHYLRQYIFSKIPKQYLQATTYQCIEVHCRSKYTQNNMQ